MKDKVTQHKRFGLIITKSTKKTDKQKLDIVHYTNPRLTIKDRQSWTGEWITFDGSRTMELNVSAVTSTMQNWLGAASSLPRQDWAAATTKLLRRYAGNERIVKLVRNSSATNRRHFLYIGGTYIHTYIQPFNSPFSGTTQVSRYQKGKTNLDITEARDSEWQWHQLGYIIYASLHLAPDR